MIVSASGPLDPSIRGLRALYVSLNSPVVTLAALPVGPATALVAVHEPPADGATLAVCSGRTGTVAFYTASGAGRDGPAAAEIAAETVLSFAESLGFLFDEALAPASAPRELLARWRSWGGVGDESPQLPEDPLEDLAPVLELSKFRLPLPGAGAGVSLDRAVASALRSAAPAAADLEVPARRMHRP